MSSMSFVSANSVRPGSVDSTVGAARRVLNFFQVVLSLALHGAGKRLDSRASRDVPAALGLWSAVHA